MRLARNPSVTETPLDGEIFLVETHRDEVFYLDTVSSGLWRLLVEPLGLDELQAAYRDAFPDAESGTVNRDVATAVEDMTARGLIVPFDTSPEGSA